MRRAEKKILTLETRRRELTIATLESIRKHGYMNSTISTISEESGLSRGLISHYFKNKDDLILFASAISRSFWRPSTGRSCDPGEPAISTSCWPAPW